MPWRGRTAAATCAFAALLCLCAACWHAAPAYAAEDNTAQPAGAASATGADFHQGAPCQAGEVLVRFEDGADPAEAVQKVAYEAGLAGLRLWNASDELEESADAGDAGGADDASHASDASMAHSATEPATSSDYVKLALPHGTSVTEAVEALKACASVQAVQPNYRYFLLDDGADQAAFETGVNTLRADYLGRLGLQSFEVNDYDPNASDQWNLASVHAPEAWEYARGDTPVQDAGRVTVAIIDNVFNVEHEDLKANVVAAYNAATDDPADMAGENYAAGDKNHGTHVAGIVAAEAGNGMGVAGVSHNAQIMPVRTANDSGSFDTEALLRAYRYIMENAKRYNVRVINMSLGAPVGWREGSTYVPDTSWEDADDALLRAIDGAWDAGIVTVTAAANAGTYNMAEKDGDNSTAQRIRVSAPFSCYPGDYFRTVNVINLARSGSSVTRSSTSNYNLEGQMAKNISAPGSNVKSTANSGADSYVTMGGTSMAAPCVAGILALIFTSDPALTPEQAVSQLYSTATDLGDPGFDEEFGYGEADALAAISAGPLALAGETELVVGGSARLSLVPPQAKPVAWSCDDETVASIEGDGNSASLAGVAAGSTIVTASVEGANGETRSAMTMVTVYDPAIEGPTGLVHGAGAQLKVAEGNPTGVWVWESSNPDVVAVGEATGYATATGVGEAEVSVHLHANPAVRSSARITVRPASIASCAFSYPKSKPYTGKKVTLANLKVTFGSAELVRGVDYTVAYRNNKAAGSATATVTGIGNFAGSKTLSFKIARAANPLVVKAKAVKLKASRLKHAKAKVARKKALVIAKAKGARTYTKVSGSKRFKVAKRTGRITVKKGTPRGTYRLKIRVRAAGTANYKPGSKTVAVRVRVR